MDRVSARLQARRSERRFVGVSVLLFGTSVAATIASGRSMSAMHGMPMPGGWTMSMAWMRMPGQNALAPAASFVGMWLLMMMAMMLPSLLPMLRRYREAVRCSGIDESRLSRLTLLAGALYFGVWTAWGVAVFVPGFALAQLAMQSPSLSRLFPLAAGVTLLVAGAWQFSAGKARQLACCRQAPRCTGARLATAGAALRHGGQLGLRCGLCCANLTAVLLVIGVMDLWAMALVTAAISAERLAPQARRVERAVGVIIIAAGVLATLRALLLR